ncbi:hypothetical protein VM98_33975, partial [Streptomyces rubellomurinus subsp. indigoferus]
ARAVSWGSGRSESIEGEASTPSGGGGTPGDNAAFRGSPTGTPPRGCTPSAGAVDSPQCPWGGFLERTVHAVRPGYRG